MIDELDLEILKTIQEDGRMSNKELAAKVGLAQSATSERLRKLRERGVIERYDVRLNADELGYGLLAFIFVRTNELASGCQNGQALAAIPEVQEVFNIAGEDCYLVKVRAKSAEHLGRILREKIGAIEYITTTRTTIVMDTYKETCKLPLSEIDLTDAGGKNGRGKRGA